MDRKNCANFLAIGYDREGYPFIKGYFLNVEICVLANRCGKHSVIGYIRANHSAKHFVVRYIRVNRCVQHFVVGGKIA